MSQEADRSEKFPHPHQGIIEACFIDINRFSMPFYAERDGGARLNPKRSSALRSGSL
jgi:hypothetical protein